jgi:hypothetical protein
MSQAYEQLLALGGEIGTYTPAGKAGRSVLALIDPVRRTDALGNQSFLTKTYDLWIVKSASEGVATVKVGFDTFAIKLLPDDLAPTTLRITKISPERDDGVPGDGVGMWHLEAVA